MYENNFKRVEIKYLIDKKTKDSFLKLIKGSILKDKYFNSYIHNIYFDTTNNDLIVNSLEKPLYKDKYRLRSYNIPCDDDEVFFEIKFKYNKVVGKRRIKIKLKDYYDYLNNNYCINDQIFKEIDYYFKYYKLAPKIYIAYDRTSYIGKNDKSIRITFDNNLRSRTTNLRFNNEEGMIKYFDKDMYIMEIKVSNNMPLWLVKSLSKLKMYPTSFSKYGKIYERSIKNV